jgi:hypothetical protein
MLCFIKCFLLQAIHGIFCSFSYFKFQTAQTLLQVMIYAGAMIAHMPVFFPAAIALYDIHTDMLVALLWDHLLPPNKLVSEFVCILPLHLLDVRSNVFLGYWSLHNNTYHLRNEVSKQPICVRQSSLPFFIPGFDLLGILNVQNSLLLVIINLLYRMNSQDMRLLVYSLAIYSIYLIPQAKTKGCDFCFGFFILELGRVIVQK